MFRFKIWKFGEDIILAVSDHDIVGKRFESGEIEIYVSNEFYSENHTDSKGILKLAEEATIINAVGNKVIEVLVDNKIIDNDKILEIGETKHAQVVVVR